MASGLNPQGSRYTHNDAAFVEYNTRLQSSNLPTFTSAASKLTEWLGSEKAYYPNARVPIVSIVESAHANICRVQGDPFVPFKLDKALPSLDPWYQPYLSLLKKVGNHLNHFEPELRVRLQLLVENAGIKIVQVPTLAENTCSQHKSFPPTERNNDHTTFTGANDDSILMDASSQASCPSNRTQQPYGTIPPVTNLEPSKKGRRKLNSAIFDIDTAAALRTNAQTAPKTVEVKGSPFSDVAIRQEATGTVHQTVSLPEGPPESASMERAPDVGNLAEEQLHAKIKDAEPSPEVAVAVSGHALTENSQLLEEVTGVKQPREGFSVNLLQESEPGNNASSRGYEDQPERLETITDDSLSKEVDTSNPNDEPSGPPDSQAETTPEPMDIESPMNSLVPAPDSEEAGIGMNAEASEQPQTVLGIVEDVGGETPSHCLSSITTHGIVRRRDSDDSLGEEGSIKSLEPLAKRIRQIDSGATTMMAPSTSISRASTPEASPRGTSGPVIPPPWSSSATRRMQQSSSNMIPEADNEAISPYISDKGAVDENTIHDDGAQPSEQDPPAETASEPRTETPAVEFHENQVMGETQVPSVQDPSLASPVTKPNPFTESRIFLRTPDALVRSTVIPDVRCLSFHSPTIHDALSSTIASQTPAQKPYVFSAVEIRTLVASRGSDEGSGPNKLVFYLDRGLTNGISKWRNFKAGQGPLEGSLCLSLACYPVDSVAPLMSTATEKQPFDALIMQARIKSSWPSDPSFRSTLRDGSGKSYAIPPFLVLQTTDDNFVDISESAIPGTNTYTIEDNGQCLSNWLFAIYVHTPTIAYFNAVKTRTEKAAKWVETLKSFTTYSLPVVNWDALQSQEPS